MKKLSYSFCVLLCLFYCFAFSSCATTLNVRLTRPANLDLNGASTIAVLPFKPYAYYKNTNTSLGMEILINTFYQIFDINDSDEQLIIDSLRSKIEKGLLESPYITLVNADLVEKAVKKGQINPADVYLAGEVSYFDIDDDKTEERVLVKAAKGDEKAEYKTEKYWKRTVCMNLRYQVIDSSTSKVISYDEVRMKNTSSRYNSKSSLPSAYSILESDIKYSARKILENLQPYAVTKSLHLFSAKTKDKVLKSRMKVADQMADNNQLQDSYTEFYRIYQETGLMEAGYNAAIIQEALGNLSVAEKMMMEVYERYPETKVYKALNDIQNEIKLANRLNTQINKTESEDLDF